MRNNIKHTLWIVIVHLFSYISGYSQGCSDAGVCSIDGHLNSDKSLRLSTNLSQSIELGEQNVVYLHTTADLSYKLSAGISTSLVLPFRTIIYKKHWYKYVGDITWAVNGKLSSKWNLSGAVKIPLSNADASDNAENPLPMALQSGLGTYDVLLSTQYKMNNWEVTAGYQLPLGTNKNTFVSNNMYPGFGTSYVLNRGDDALLRLRRKIAQKNGDWELAVLALYRIGGDKILNGQKVDGSEGLSINTNMSKTFFISNQEVQLGAAVPLFVRESRVDGLTRTFIISAKWLSVF
jgi:hypothetical protein